MTCVPDIAQFRLLNHLVGWDPDVTEGLAGLQSAEGVQLQPLGDAQGSLDPSTLSMWIPPARLAKAYGVCRWYLITPCPPRSRLLVRDACDPCWTEPAPGARGVLRCARAIALSPNRIAVTDSAEQAVFFFTDQGRRQLGRVAFHGPGAIAYAAWREWLVVDEQAGALRRLDMAGVDRGLFSPALPADKCADIDRLAVDDACRVWIAVRQTDGRFRLWRAGRHDSAFEPASLIDLQSAFEPTGLAMVTDQGFCFDPAAGPEAQTGWDAAKSHAGGSAPAKADKPKKEDSCGPCSSWYGRPAASLPAATAAPLFVDQGQLLTVAVDSGVPRCRWHRVRLDARTPLGTTVAVAVASSERPDPVPQGSANGEWSGFQPGVPHPADWQEGPLNSADFLVQQPPGRYLFLRLRLTGDGFKTPRVQRIRLDFPRRTSLDRLPYVYRENPEAEDFSERFLALFDAVLENVDDTIERLPALLDAVGVPDAVLPWLGRYLDIAMDPAWDARRRRRILLAAPKLYRMRGTVDGMRAAVALVFDVDPVIEELPIQRPWGAVGKVRLAAGARLFGPSRWRFRLDRSRLSQAPIRSYGNPDRDPFNALVWRFRVLVPLALNDQTRQRMQLLIEAQKPAHTVASLHDRSGAFVLGPSISLGIDTAFRPFEPSVLSGNGPGIRLGRGSILSSAPAGAAGGVKVGQNSTVGGTSTLG